jgi:homoserine kinase type II
MRSLLKREYDIEVARIELIPSGRINRNFRVMAEDGKEYCVKVYSDAVPDHRLQDGLRVANYLSPLGFPVPTPVPTRTGEQVLREHMIRYLVLNYLPGRNLLPGEIGQTECFGMGLMLARLHQSLRFFPEADKLDSAQWRDSAGSLKRARELLELIQNKPEHDDFDNFALHSHTMRIRILQSIEIGPDQFGHLTQQALHGDYHLANVIFDGEGRVTGVLDFDQTCFSFPAWELMRALGFTCFQGGRFNYEFAGNLLRGYISTSGSMSAADYLEMPRVWYYQLVRGLWGLREHYDGEADPRQDEAAYGRHETMVWLGDNLSHIRQFIWETVSPSLR